MRQWTATLFQRRSNGSLHNLAEGVAEAAVSAATVDVPLRHVFVALEPGECPVLIVGGGSFRGGPPNVARRQVVDCGAETVTRSGAT